MNNAISNTSQPPEATLMGMSSEELCKPFGLELGKTRIRDLEEIFVITCEQGTGFTKGPVYQVIPRYIEEPEAECIVLAFDEKGKLDAAWFNLPSVQFRSAVQILSHRFELLDQNNPIKGSESALFKYADGQVALNAPLFSKEMTLGYRTEKFNNARMAAAADMYE